MQFFLLFRPFAAAHYWLLPLILILLAAIALAVPRVARRFSRAFNGSLLASSRTPLAYAAVALLPAIAAAVFFCVHGFPTPYVHDEFSYLLASDTFAHGRLTNPPHPFAEHFESFHVNQRPTYASMYPPGQGLVMAAGTIFFGHHWAGVWVSVTVLCLLTYWALSGWLPARWALLGGFWAGSLAPLGYWMTTYWGGAVAAAGGALVLGAWPRVKRRPSVRYSLLLALGVAILANTRMYEGAVLVGVAATALAWSFAMHPVTTRKVCFRRVLVPAGLVLLVASCWMMYYFWRVTGDPLLMPYVVNFRTYGYRSLFLWQPDRPPPLYLHDVMQRMYSVGYSMTRSDPRFLPAQLWPTLDQFGGSLLLLPLFGLWWLVRSPKLRGLLIATAFVAVAVSLSAWIRPHYLAPAMVGLIGITIQALRYLATVRWGKIRIGAFVAPALAILFLGAQWKTGLALLVMQHAPVWATQRAAIERQLEQAGKRHLILVRYGPQHDPNQEWVYNRADLFTSPVLWAREMGPDQDHLLILYCRNRTVWLLEPDRDGTRLVPY